jgi:DNA-3-methyladenine glycosylase
VIFPVDVLSAGAEVAAPRLIGAVLESRAGGTLTRGRIVETEAYLAFGDGASHSARGKTARNGAMFMESGRGYVYLIYGLHLCFNVVTGAPGEGEAVLVRALEPLGGVETMRTRRGGEVSDRNLARGPGRLTRAMGITRDDDRKPVLDGGSLRLLDRAVGWGVPELDVGPRVGITKSAELPLRFRLRGSRWTS